MTQTRIQRGTSRNTTEGKSSQTVTVDIIDNDSSDEVERWQNYGLASSPVDGSQALVVTTGGHRVVVALDETAVRPKLGSAEVCLYHREGHQIHLKAGRIIELTADKFIVNADVEITGDITQQGSHESTGDQIAGGISQINHKHMETGTGTPTEEPQ